MQEMVGTARRMGNHAIATRHMTYLLEVMFDHCSDTEKTDFSSQLSVLTSRHPGKFDHCSDTEKTNVRFVVFFLVKSQSVVLDSVI